MTNLTRLTRAAASAALLLTLAACDGRDNTDVELEGVEEATEADEAMGSLTGTAQPSSTQEGSPGGIAPPIDPQPDPNVPERGVRQADPTVEEPIEPMPPEVLDEGVEEGVEEARPDHTDDPFNTTPDTIDRSRSRAQPVN